MSVCVSPPDPDHAVAVLADARSPAPTKDGALARDVGGFRAIELPDEREDAQVVVGSRIGRR